jgi:hypothetical protein
MKLNNFSLLDDMITIEAEGEEWDLHNAFCLDVISHFVGERSATICWKLSGYRVPPPQAQGLEIMFHDVDYFEVTPRDSEIPDYGEDLCLNMLSRVPVLDGGFHLLFEFRGGQNVRVGARMAELKPKSSIQSND